jgi:hypothetical protein
VFVSFSTTIIPLNSVGTSEFCYLAINVLGYIIQTGVRGWRRCVQVHSCLLPPVIIVNMNTCRYRTSSRISSRSFFHIFQCLAYHISSIKPGDFLVFAPIHSNFLNKSKRTVIIANMTAPLARETETSKTQSKLVTIQNVIATFYFGGCAVTFSVGCAVPKVQKHTSNCLQIPFVVLFYDANNLHYLEYLL